jgi:RNA polymerase sigma-70 factor (ECF subfamily)
MNMNEKSKLFLGLYDAHVDAIFRHCLFKVSDRELAQDLTQQTFLQLWTYLKNDQHIDKPKPLLYRIAGNLVIDWYRKKKADSLDSLMDAGYDTADTKGENIEQSAEIQNILKKASELPQDDQNLIFWRFVEDMTPKEIAEILDERENTVSVRIHRALEQLRSLMKTI